MKNLMENMESIRNIIRRAHYLANQMIFMANHRANKEKGDPKVGGHSSASSSAIHLVGALHLFVKTGFDHISNKPHASPADHAYNYLLDLFLNEDLSKMSLQDANTAMEHLRAFSDSGQPVFQSYHSAYDPDHHNFFPSGTVGIPPVNAGYLAHAYRYARKHGYNVPDAHFWSIIGDSEFREGSLFEAVPDFAERELGNLTWVIDYNRQSLDGHRITNPDIIGGNDCERIEKTMQANGWEVIQLRHGYKREALFKKKEGATFKNWLEQELQDYELQALLLIKEPQELRDDISKKHTTLNNFLKGVSNEELFAGLRDFGGHDIVKVVEALLASKKDSRRPTCIVAHTLKGWHLEMAAHQGNHSALPSEEEMLKLRQGVGLSADTLFARFDSRSPEGKLLKQRGEQLYKEIKKQHELKNENQKFFQNQLSKYGELSKSLDINFKMANYPHTQWMLGQLTSKLSRFANTPIDEKKLAPKQKALTTSEKAWKLPAELITYMAPDVGTSTNLNPSMDGKIFNASPVEDFEGEYKVRDAKLPDLIPGEEAEDRFIRFEISEANVMSCLGSFGRMRDILGIPILPFMTVYDFFVKRAMDQYFYDLYWKSSFILCGTPAGVSLSPEGAQHGWKSDFQIPNQITWEPFFCQELDWILTESIRRHVFNDNEGRTGVLIRGVTRGIEQKDFMGRLKSQVRFQGFNEEQILENVRLDVLNGGYYLVNYEGFEGYDPGDNVVHIFSLGCMGTEALKASDALLEKGIYANVIVVTSPDLLIGNLGHENQYHHLKNTLKVNSNLFLKPMSNGGDHGLSSAEIVTLAGRRVPIVSVHDGEPGLLDNLGSIIGVRQEALAVRKHSKCGRPSDVYQFHGIDSGSVYEACLRVLAETALEQVEVKTQHPMEALQPKVTGPWQQLWPSKH